VSQAQEFVLGGYTVGGCTYALIFGYYEDRDLVCVARTRNGFTPKIREDLLRDSDGSNTPHWLFSNLPEERSGRWGAGLTAAKMKDCRWLKPALVGQFEFVEWTPDGHLRHTRFMELREDQNAQDGTGER
jgi:ATP-dependent DNA ligase